MAKQSEVCWVIPLTFRTYLASFRYRLWQRKKLLLVAGAILGVNAITMLPDLLDDAMDLSTFLISVVVSSAVGSIILMVFLIFFVSGVAYMKARKAGYKTQRVCLTEQSCTVGVVGMESRFDRQIMSPLTRHRRGFTTQIKGVGRFLLIAPVAEHPDIERQLKSLGWL